MAEVRLIPQMISPSGMTQLQMIVAGLVLIAPAMMWNGTIAMNTKPHSALSLRLMSSNRGEPQYCSGTCSRAYCSVNGTNKSDPNAIAARINAAIPRA